MFFQGARYQQLRLRAARAIPAALRARRPQHGLVGAVGDRGVQAAEAVTQRRPVQANLRNLHRVQRNRVKDRQRTQVVIDEFFTPVAGLKSFDADDDDEVSSEVTKDLSIVPEVTLLHLAEADEEERFGMAGSGSDLETREAQQQQLNCETVLPSSNSLSTLVIICPV